MIDTDIKLRIITCADCGQEYITHTPIEAMLDEYVRCVGDVPPLHYKEVCQDCYDISKGKQ